MNRKMLATTATVVSALMLGVGNPSSAMASPATSIANLRYAMNTESFAYASYNAYADNAAKHHDPTAANTWRTIADVEYWDHFVSEGKQSGLVGDNASNLRAAIAAEKTAIRDYGTGITTAESEGCTKVAKTYRAIRKDEQDHLQLFQTALTAITTGKGSVPAGPAPADVTIRQTKPVKCGAGTMKTLDDSMHSEAFSWGSYSQWAEKAANTGKPALAALFTEVGRIELKDHFATEANLAGLVQGVPADLATSVKSESDANNMYTRFISQATTDGDSSTAALFTEIRQDERGHRQSFVTLQGR